MLHTSICWNFSKSLSHFSCPFSYYSSSNLSYRLNQKKMTQTTKKEQQQDFRNVTIYYHMMIVLFLLNQ